MSNNGYPSPTTFTKRETPRIETVVISYPPNKWRGEPRLTTPRYGSRGKRTVRHLLSHTTAGRAPCRVAQPAGSLSARHSPLRYLGIHLADGQKIAHRSQLRRIGEVDRSNGVLPYSRGTACRAPTESCARFAGVLPLYSVSISTSTLIPRRRPSGCSSRVMTTV